MNNTKHTTKLAIIGAGPVGLAAAAHAIAQGLEFQLFESEGHSAGSMREWGHVRVFTPWEFITDKAAVKLLEATQWVHPQMSALPTANEIISRYLEPLASLPELSAHTQYNAEVTAISKKHASLSLSPDRADKPFVLHWTNGEGNENRSEFSAIIDASGTWKTPNPLGTDGLTVPGERNVEVAYGMPDILGLQRERYENSSTLVVGSGHSAMNSVLALLDLQEESEKTAIQWAHRRDADQIRNFADANDGLEARGELAKKSIAAITSGKLELLSGFSIESLEHSASGRIRVRAGVNSTGGNSQNEIREFEVDNIIAATGFRPDLSLSRELRLDLDNILEAPVRLAPMIDPNLHSCGTVEPHGFSELAHSEKNYFIAGAKSYGRAPTFLMATGYEQVRSVTAMLAGNRASALKVELILPETGVCDAKRSPLGGGACCGGPAIGNADACCGDDEKAKAEGLAGCGC